MKLLFDQFSKADAENRFVVGLIGERAVFSELMAKLPSDPNAINRITDNQPEADPQEQPGAAIPAVTAAGYFESDLLYYLQSMRRMITLAKLPPENWLAEENAGTKIDSSELRMKHLFSTMLLRHLSMLAERNAGQHAYLRTALLTLAIERWRLNHQGQIPESLEILAPTYFTNIPTDPFDGKPMRYKHVGNRYTVYSVGANGIDDGGIKFATETEQKQNRPRDIVFRVNRK